MTIDIRQVSRQICARVEQILIQELDDDPTNYQVVERCILQMPAMVDINTIKEKIKDIKDKRKEQERVEKEIQQV
jgi:hypothetical protein